MEGATDFYLTQGVLGVTVAVLLVVCFTLWRDNARLQESRLTETKSALTSVTKAVETLDKALEVYNEINRRGS